MPVNMLTIKTEIERLQFGELHFGMLEKLADQGCGISWDRAGLVGKILNTQLRDLIRVWGAYRILVERGRVSEVPALARGFVWCETTEHYQLPTDDCGDDSLSPKADAGPHGRSAGANP